MKSLKPPQKNHKKKKKRRKKWQKRTPTNRLATRRVAGARLRLLRAHSRSGWLTIDSSTQVDDEELSLAPLPGPSARASPSAAPWWQRQPPCPEGRHRRADKSEDAPAASGADSKGSKKRDRNKHQGGDDVKKDVKRMRLSPGFRQREHNCTFTGGWLSPP